MRILSLAAISCVALVGACKDHSAADDSALATWQCPNTSDGCQNAPLTKIANKTMSLWKAGANNPSHGQFDVNRAFPHRPGRESV